ncbi:MAG: carboxypeptidase regulatory-like domain-containing protein [bacterium]|nr:carboxypeptidase regulatory-like domain-containing protein [bacterium]
MRVFNHRKHLNKVTSVREISTGRGFSLIEVLISVAVFLFIAVSVYDSYVGLLNLVRVSRVKIAAADLGNEQFEIIRNMPYASVGLQSGVPSGTLLRFQTLVRDGITFQATTTIQNIDDPFDGTLVSVPVDTAPADYKLVQVEVGCYTCRNFSPLIFTGRVSPKNLEMATNNGSLVIRVFDSNGNPVPNADVHIVNDGTNPSIDIIDKTNANGIYELIDTEPSNNSYSIVISKAGYSTEQTYPVSQTNPNPTLQDATVVQQGVTQISFFIDKVSTFNIATVYPNCAPVPSVSFELYGTKIIGKDPSDNPILKYDSILTTNSSGLMVLSDMEWDTYNFNLTDLSYDLAGTISPLPVNLAADSSQNVTLVVAPTNPKSILFSVKDAGSDLPQANATVELTDNGGFEETLVTGRGSLTQTDWSEGGGQENFINVARYFSQDGNIEDDSPGGELSLIQPFNPGPYQTSGQLVSSTFDTGSVSNYYQLLWNPLTQPVETGTPNVRFQIATNNDNATWNFAGPDDTSSTYYTIGNQNISSANNGNRYLRYKLFLDSASNAATPTVSDIAFTYTSLCVPPGQVLFSGLSNGSYDFTVTKSGYQPYSGTVNVNASAPWQNVDVPLQTD